MFKVKLIINFSAGKVSKNTLNVNRLIQKISELNIEIDVCCTSIDKSDRSVILSNLNYVDAIIVCGGDGTLNKVINYMIGESIFKPILLIPGGTANVFHLEKKLTAHIDKAINNLIKGRRVKTDIGFVEHEHGINYFLLMVGIGIDSQAVKNVDMNIKKLLGKTSYLFSGVRNFITYKSKQIELEVDNKIISNVHTVIISNSRLYGGNIELFPEADMHDGLLDMCIFTADNNVTLLKNIVNIQYGKHIEQPFVNYSKIESVKVKSLNNEKMPFQIDGEFVGYLPVKIGILREKIEFILT